jgi:galactokinase
VTDRDALGRTFHELFGTTPRFFFAPGRVNLIGEHTDYNDGFVLPMALHEGTLVAGAARADRRVRARSLNLDDTIEVDLDEPGTPRPGSPNTWLAYVEGVARELVQEGLHIRGADLLLSSDVAIGSGLSSSAALEVSVGLALSKLSEMDVDPVVLAHAGRAAEHHWVGVQSGIMDQFTAVFGRPGHALLIDCRELSVLPVPVDASQVAVVLCDSQEHHELAASEYNTRREECRRAVELIRAAHPAWNGTALRDAAPEMLEELDRNDPAVRRARHVVDENRRTRMAATALSDGAFGTVGELMIASHESLRRLFEVSTRRLDFLVEQAVRLSGVYGARMTGGGFGGCTVNLVAADRRSEFMAGMARAWSSRFDSQPVFHPALAGSGAAEMAV